MSTCPHSATDRAASTMVKNSAQAATTKGDISASQLGTSTLFPGFHLLSSTPRCLSTNFPLPFSPGYSHQHANVLLTNNLPNSHKKFRRII